MDGDEFKEAIRRLGFTHSSFARGLGLTSRTVQRWVVSGPPEHVAYFLRAMTRQFVPEPHDLVWTATDGGVGEAAGAFELSLQAWLQRAVHAGWPQEMAAAGAIACLARLLYEMRKKHLTRT